MEKKNFTFQFDAVFSRPEPGLGSFRASAQEPAGEDQSLSDRSAYDCRNAFTAFTINPIVCSFLIKLTIYSSRFLNFCCSSADELEPRNSGHSEHIRQNLSYFRALSCVADLSRRSAGVMSDFGISSPNARVLRSNAIPPSLLAGDPITFREFINN